MAEPFVAVVMAAGQGTRMKSELPKVLHRVAGRPLYAHVTDAALRAGAQKVAVVVGHGREQVRASIAELFDERVTSAVQEQQLGTGDAVRAGLTVLPEFEGWVVILSGDTPLIHSALIEQLLQAAASGEGPLALLTSRAEDPTGYGRILRNTDGQVTGIREHKDCSEGERQIPEINPAVYAVKASFLRQALSALSTDNAQGELYLTDIVSAAAEQAGVASQPWPLEDTQGVNDRSQLADCETAMRLRIARALARSGVAVRDPATTYVECSVSVEAGAVLEPNVHLRGDTHIGAEATVDTGCVLTDVRVAAGAQLLPYTVASQSVIGERAQTGPFSHLRPNSDMGEGSKVGNFVEMKQTNLGPGSKANHLAYIGNGEIGRDVNIGAGTIFCNYDGFRKHTTTLKDGVFIGSDSQLVAPVTVGVGAYVGTGTTLTRNVPDDALALSRTKQVNKEGYASRLKARFKAAKEAALAKKKS